MASKARRNRTFIAILRVFAPVERAYARPVILCPNIHKDKFSLDGVLLSAAAEQLIKECFTTRFTLLRVYQKEKSKRIDLDNCCDEGCVRQRRALTPCLQG